jgi:hypothetical protein
MSDLAKSIVLLGEKPSATERFAAAELAKHLRFIIGAPVRVAEWQAASQKSVRENVVAFLGTADDHSALRAASLPADLPEQAFALRSIPNPWEGEGSVLAVLGGDPRGVLHAVRDLQHYHWLDGSAVPQLDLEERPAAKYRLFQSWDYYIVDPYAYIDRLSEWKINGLGICTWRYLYERQDIIPYAKERGIDVTITAGIYSWQETGTAVHNMRSLLPEPAPPEITRADGGHVICPSEERNQKWMMDSVLSMINKIDGLHGFYFQTGVFDYADCSCDKCRSRSAPELFRSQADQIIDVVSRERPDIRVSYGISTRQVATDEFLPVLAEIDRRALPLLENRYPIPNSSDMDRLDKAIPRHYGLLGKVYGQDFLVKGWREHRQYMLDEMTSSIADAIRRGAYEIDALIETRQYHKRQLYLPAVFAESAWSGGRIAEEKFQRIRAITDLDQRISDPEQVSFREGSRHVIIKRPVGTEVDGGWDWGSLRVGVRIIANFCDLLSEKEEAAYTFHLPSNFRKDLKSARLTITGAKDYLPETTGDYIFDILVNGESLGRIVSPWEKGECVVHRGTSGHNEATKPQAYLGITDWRIDIPVDTLQQQTGVTLRFLEPGGLVMYEKMTLELAY